MEICDKYVYMYECIVFLWYVHACIYEYRLQRATNSTFHTGIVALTNAAKRSIAHTHRRKENKSKKGMNGREKPDIISLNKRRSNVGGKNF